MSTATLWGGDESSNITPIRQVSRPGEVEGAAGLSPGARAQADAECNGSDLKGGLPRWPLAIEGHRQLQVPASISAPRSQGCGPPLKTKLIA